MEERDIIVIGGGPGGYVAAIHAAHLGAKVALVEKDKLGGTCLNRGCIPTKALVRSAEVLLDIKRADEFGIDVNGASANFQKIMSRKRSVVDQLVSGVERLMTSNRISVHRGAARLTSPNSVMVNGEELHAKKVIVASGSESTLL
ncbi:MAG TPA: dihydrolipoyl dehydrogenase, partial [Dehalococcoidia bacterium]|nr:dihydrolipoyl dehydrogenase [Dehalococcoidia bacterium]